MEIRQFIVRMFIDWTQIKSLLSQSIQNRIRVDRKDRKRETKKRESRQKRNKFKRKRQRRERKESSSLCCVILNFSTIPAGVYRDHKLRFIAVAAPPLGGLSYRYVSMLQLYLHFLRNEISCQHRNRPTAN